MGCSARCRHLVNATERSVCGGDADLKSNYFDRLLLSLLQILQAKVQRLERLVNLKDIRVKDLQTRLLQLQDAEADNSPADRPRIIHR